MVHEVGELVVVLAAFDYFVKDVSVLEDESYKGEEIASHAELLEVICLGRDVGLEALLDLFKLEESVAEFVD